MSYWPSGQVVAVRRSHSLSRGRNLLAAPRTFPQEHIPTPSNLIVHHSSQSEFNPPFSDPLPGILPPPPPTYTLPLRQHDQVGTSPTAIASVHANYSGSHVPSPDCSVCYLIFIERGTACRRRRIRLL